MNGGLTLTGWLQLVGLLAVEMALVVGVAALISRFVASAVWRRTIWQVCFLSLLALTLSELTGTARSLVSWLAAKASPEKLAAVGPTASNRGDQRGSGQLQLSRKVAEKLARENELESGETADATPWVFQPAGTDTRPAPALIDTRQIPPNGPEAGIEDLLAILWLELIWLLGAGLVIARSCLAHVLFSLFRRHRPAVSDAELLGRVESLARLLGMKRRIHLIESSGLAGPIVFGVFRPVIGLPTEFAERFSPVEQEAMLAHELAHVAAHDTVWYSVANWASAILWWHPFVWWARRRLHAACEVAADEASLVVADGPVALAECLAALGAQLTQRRSFGWMGVEGNGLRSGLGRRVERLVHLRGNSYASPNRLRSALAKTFGPAALVATAMLSTAWVGPQAFTKGESMQTMKQTWSRSLAAFAFLTTLGTDNQITLAANADQRTGEKHASPAAATLPAIAENPTAPDPATKPPTVEPASSQQAFYYRLMMERYGVRPPGVGPPTGELPRISEPLTRKRSPIAAQLEKIVLDEVAFDGVPLSEVLKFLDAESRKRDPEKHGINFLINPNGPPVAASQTIDPTTGQPITLPSPEPLDMNSVTIRFNLPLRNMRLKDVLDAIVKVADRPIEYSVEEYGVVFSQSLNPSTGSTSRWASSSAEQVPLEVRTFMVDAEKLLPGLKRTFGISLEGLPANRPNDGPSGSDAEAQTLRKELESLETTLTNLLAQFTGESVYVQKVRARIDALKELMKGKSPGEPGEEGQIKFALRRLLTQLGINMDVPGKTVFYNDLTGIVMVRATLEDLEIVRAAIETLGGSGIGQFAQPGPAKDGTMSRYEEMMRRYGIDPTQLGAAKR
jgi:beta-lactamase regulating signal transducer with metallopeptidase domain